MAKRGPETTVESFEQRAEAFLATHLRIVSDFERSLKNARHFIKLGDRSMEQEPDATIQMIEQVREIDLLRHITEQFEEYQSVEALLPAAGAPGGPLQDDAGLQGQIRTLHGRYEQLLQEAESQAQEMEKLITSLTVLH